MKPEKMIKNLIEQIDVTPDEVKYRNTLDAMLKAQAESEPTASGGTHLSIWRTIMKNRMLKISVAAVILLAVLITFNMGTQSAYAQVVEGLRKARTLTYTLIRQTNVEPGQTVSIQIAHKAPHHIRTTTVDGYISILDDAQGKMISLIPETQMYITAEYKNLLSLEGTDPFEGIESMKNLPATADEKLGEKEIDGVLAEGYRVFENDTIITIWVNSDTKKLVQIEQDYPSSPGMNYIMRDIQWDVNLDDSLFSLTPPAGYKEGPKLSANIAQITEADFIGFFEIWIDTTVDKTFPPTFWSPEFGKIVIEMAKQGKFERPWTEADAQAIYQGNMFLAQVPQDDWRYMGANVPFGDADTPIFWYRPVGSDTYRVIYGDLHVEDKTSEDLPQQ